MLDVNFIKITELERVLAIHVEAWEMNPVCRLADELATSYDVLLVQHVYNTRMYQIVVKRTNAIDHEMLLNDVKKIIKK